MKHIFGARAEFSIISDLVPILSRCMDPWNITMGMTMDKTGKMYNYTEAGKSYLLPTNWGGSCKDWEAQDKTGLAAAWGCSTANKMNANHWCNNAWCYVNACD